MTLRFASLEKSLDALAAVLAASGNDERMGQLTDVERVAIRAGVVQHFEIAYELCWKLIARWLNANTSPGIADGVARRQLFRLAAENRLIGDVDKWMRHHESRNTTSRIYDFVKAETVYRATVDFVHDAKALLGALKARNDRPGRPRPSGASRFHPAVDIRPGHLDIVLGALRRHVPDREVLAFGSRATWTSKDCSDLDLAIMGGEPLPQGAAAALDEALVESELPFRVDIVEWGRIDEGFRSVVLRHAVSVRSPAP